MAGDPSHYVKAQAELEELGAGGAWGEMAFRKALIHALLQISDDLSSLENRISESG